MSVHVLSWVFKNSTATLGARLVLLVLADHAGHDGTGAYPSVKTIAREARLDQRTARRCLRSLEEDGLIEYTGESPYGTRTYTVKTDLGKFEELPPLNVSLSLPSSPSGSTGRFGGHPVPKEVTGCPPGQIAPRRLRAVGDG